MNKPILSLILAIFLFIPGCLFAQRKTIPLGRGVVAVNNGSNVSITWRRLAQEPEDIKYNVYINGTKLNASPLSTTNTTATYDKCAEGANITVTTVSSDGNIESEQSVPFVYSTVKLGSTTIKNAGFAVNFTQAGSPLPNDGSFVTKYCWPVDLDGDGEMEYVTNRVYTRKDQNGYEGWGDDKLGGDCLEAYTRQGKHLWTVNLGVHFFSFGGQNDGVCVGDFDGDGKGEVIVQLCEGARFWNSATRDFGKYLYYNGVQQHYSGSGTQTVSSDGSNPDIDGDKTTNYTYYSKGKNPQWYFAVIDGLTGEQKDVCAMTLPSDNSMTYTRANKSAFMNDEYSYLSPAMGAAFLDGVHQSAVGQFQCRTSAGAHHYFTYAYGYQNGEFKELWRFRFYDHSGLSEFHHIRIGDVDGDGKDEVMNGQCAVDHDGSLLWTSGISHGDRFRMSDIDPDRPGQEIFAIQQNAPDMLGMILYDATDGSHIKKWYMPSVGDVGRGECMDVDPAHKGYEMWSTMANIYDCKGNQIGTEKPYAYEGIWWDGDLGRESLITSGSGNNCPAIVAKYNAGGWQRLWEFSKESGWQIAAENAVRPMFWGDILGDWREELILKTLSGGLETGFICLSTSTSTSEKRIYCLLEDPNYFGQITNRGYYQSPNTGFYLGYDMPRPPLPPVMKEDSETKVYGLEFGNATISIPQVKNAYVMPVKGQTMTLSSVANNTATLWKGMQGTLIVPGTVSKDIKTVVSEGTLQVDGTIAGAVDLRARGVLSGKGSIGSLTMEGSLNYAEGIIKPTGTLTINSSLYVNAPIFVEIDIDKGYPLQVKGDLNVTKLLTVSIDSQSLTEGSYKLIGYTGAFTGNTKNIAIRGVVGLAYTIEAKQDGIYLNIAGTREPTSNVVWTGNESGVWNYQAKNFMLEGQATTFVANDSIIFNDDAKQKTITISEMLPAADMLVDNTTTITFNGDGGMTGTGGLRKEGTGKLYLNNKKADYTGATQINNGTVYLSELSMQGSPSSIGIGSTSPKSWQCGKATMVFNGSSLATDRGITLNDTTTFEVPTNYSTTLKGLVTGSGVLHKTGAGQLSVSYSTANSWKSTILNAGTLAQGTYNTTFGSATSLIHVTGNTKIIQFYTTSSGNAPNFANALKIDTLKTLTFVGSGRGSFKSILTGSGTLALSSGYVRFDNYMSGANFRGTVSLGSGAGRLVQAMTMKQATLNITSGVTAESTKAGDKTLSSYAFHFGNITGAGTIGAGTWTTGYANQNATFTGIFTSAVTKVGEGIWYLNPTSTSSGALIINGGAVFTAGSVPVTSALITVNSGASLRGKGQATNVTVKNGGTLGACSFNATSFKESSAAGTLTVTGNLTMQEGAVLDVLVNSLTTSMAVNKVKVNGKATLTSPVINIHQYTEGKEYLADKDMKIIDCANLSITGDVTILPAKPQTGYSWDTSDLATLGIIRVIKDKIDADVNGDGNVNKDDIDAVVSVICGETTNERADVNHDNDVNILDVNAIIDSICNK